MSAREVFHVVMTVALLILLVIAILRPNWAAAGWACFGLLGSIAGIAQERRDREVES